MARSSTISVEDHLREHATIQDLLTILQEVGDIDPMPGADIPGIVQDPEENYRQGHNHLLEDVNETIFEGLLETVRKLTAITPPPQDQDDTDDNRAAYRLGRVSALEKVASPIQGKIDGKR